MKFFRRNPEHKNPEPEEELDKYVEVDLAVLTENFAHAANWIAMGNYLDEENISVKFTKEFDEIPEGVVEEMGRRIGIFDEDGELRDGYSISSGTSPRDGGQEIVFKYKGVSNQRFVDVIGKLYSLGK